MKKLIIIFILELLQSTGFSQKNWFDSKLTECIVSLEKKVNGTLQFHGTGFIVYNYKFLGNDYIVTCEHVLRNTSIHIRAAASDKFIKDNQDIKGKSIDWHGREWYFDGTSLLTEYHLIPDSTFFVNKDLDIGVLQVELPAYVINQSRSDTIKITRSTSIPKSLTKNRDNIELGTDIYFLGFPFQIGTVMGIGGLYANNINTPLLRTGTIAWKEAASKEFLLDAFSYSGNSGSPVFTKRDVFSEKPYLIGMVIGHISDPRLPDADINIGLARCRWIDDIFDLINMIETRN